MLKTITWNNYWTAVAILAGFWYLVILLAYYRKEVFNLFSGQYKMPALRNNVPAPAGEEQVTVTQKDPASEYADAEIEELEAISEDIHHNILEPAGKEISKDDLLVRLKNRLTYYEGLGQTNYRYALNNYLIKYSKALCGVDFSEGELNAAWDSLPR